MKADLTEANPMAEQSLVERPHIPHPLRQMKPYPASVVASDLAAQEGCDGEPYDTLQHLAEAIQSLEQRAARAEKENKHLFEANRAIRAQQKEDYARADTLTAALAEKDKALQQIKAGAENPEIGNGEFRVKAASQAEAALAPSGAVMEDKNG